MSAVTRPVSGKQNVLREKRAGDCSSGQKCTNPLSQFVPGLGARIPNTKAEKHVVLRKMKPMTIALCRPQPLVVRGKRRSCCGLCCPQGRRRFGERQHGALRAGVSRVQLRNGSRVSPNEDSVESKLTQFAFSSALSNEVFHFWPLRRVCSIDRTSFGLNLMSP